MASAVVVSPQQDIHAFSPLSATGSATAIPARGFMDTQGSCSAGLTLQPIFIPRQHSALSSRSLSIQQPGSPNSNSLTAAAAAANADWAYLLRNAAALRSNGSLSGSDAALLAAAAASSQDMQGRATSPQVMSSPGSFLMVSSALQGQGMALPQNQQIGGVSNSASGLFGSNSMVSMEALGQLSAEALASAQGDPSNSFAMLGSGSLAPMLSGNFHDAAGVQSLYGSGDHASAVASAAAAAAAAAAARATSTQSILQQQAAAAAAATSANLANSLGANALAGLGNSLNLSSLARLEESLSGTLFGPGGAVAAASPKPVSASLYIKVGSGGGTVQGVEVLGMCRSNALAFCSTGPGLMVSLHCACPHWSSVH